MPPQRDHRRTRDLSRPWPSPAAYLRAISARAGGRGLRLWAWSRRDRPPQRPARSVGGYVCKNSRTGLDDGAPRPAVGGDRCPGWGEPAPGTSSVQEAVDSTGRRCQRLQRPAAGRLAVEETTLTAETKSLFQNDSR